MEKNSNALMNEMRKEVSQSRIIKLIEAKNLIKEVIHYDQSEKSKYNTIINMIDEAIVDELKVQEKLMQAKLVTKNKLPRITISTHGNLDEKKIIELLDKYQWK